MACIAFNAESFKDQFPAFGGACSPKKYSDATLQAYWDMATGFVTDKTSPCSALSLKQQTLALNLMTAHLLTLSAMIAKGTVPSVKVGSTIDKISVTLEPPPAKSQWQWWLSTTAYGQELFALLSLVAVGGLYIGARPELSAFRKAGGVF